MHSRFSIIQALKKPGIGVPAFLMIMVQAFFTGLFLAVYTISAGVVFLFHFSFALAPVAIILSGLLCLILLFLFEQAASKLSRHSLISFLIIFLVVFVFAYFLHFDRRNWSSFMAFLWAFPLNIFSFQYLRLSLKHQSLTNNDRIKSAAMKTLIIGLITGCFVLSLKVMPVNYLELFFSIAFWAVFATFFLCLFYASGINEKWESKSMHESINQFLFFRKDRFSRQVDIYNILTIAILLMFLGVFIKDTKELFQDKYAFASNIGFSFGIVLICIKPIRLIHQKLIWEKDSVIRPFMILPFVLTMIVLILIARPIFPVNVSAFDVNHLSLILTFIFLFILFLLVFEWPLSDILPPCGNFNKRHTLKVAISLKSMCMSFFISGMLLALYEFSTTKGVWGQALLFLLLSAIMFSSFFWVSAYFKVKLIAFFTWFKVHVFSDEGFESASVQAPNLSITEDGGYLKKIAEQLHPLMHRFLKKSFSEEDFTVFLSYDHEGSKLPSDMFIEESPEYLSSSEDPSYRILAAHRIAASKDHRHYVVIKNLLKDKDLNVVKAALQAVLFIKTPETILFVVEMLGSDDRCSYAFDTLLWMGDTAMDTLQNGFFLTEGKPILQIRIMRLIGNIESQKGNRFLFTQLFSPSRKIAEFAAQALRENKYKVRNIDKSAIWGIMEKAIPNIAWLISAKYSFRDDLVYSILVEAFEKEIDRSFNYLFNLLGIVYDSSAIRAIQDIVLSEDRGMRAYGWKLMELILPHEIQLSFWALLNNRSPSSQAKQLNELFYIEEQTQQELITSAICSDNNSVSIYTRAAAFYCMNKLAAVSVNEDHIAHVFNENLLLSELAALVAKQNAPERFKSCLNRMSPSKCEVLTRTIAQYQLKKKHLIFEIALNLSEFTCLKKLDSDSLVLFAEWIQESRHKQGVEFIMDRKDPEILLVIMGLFQIIIKEDNYETIGKLDIFDPDQEADAVDNFIFQALEDAIVYKLDRRKFKLMLFDHPEMIEDWGKALLHRNQHGEEKINL
jgi:hypothetical protein